VTLTGRFARYLQRNDRPKERFLAEIAAGKSEEQAVAAMNEVYGGSEATIATVRSWLRTDAEFAEALHVARTDPSSPGGIMDPRIAEEVWAEMMSEEYDRREGIGYE
jgi:hypothetical protein